MVAAGIRLVVLEQFRAFRGAGPGQANDDGDFDVQVLGALDDALRDFVAARDAAEDVEQDALDVGVGQDDLPGCW